MYYVPLGSILKVTQFFMWFYFELKAFISCCLHLALRRPDRLDVLLTKMLVLTVRVNKALFSLPASVVMIVVSTNEITARIRLKTILMRINNLKNVVTMILEHASMTLINFRFYYKTVIDYSEGNQHKANTIESCSVTQYEQ